jgi:hypothetical protein
MKYLTRKIVILATIFSTAHSVLAQDPGWPRRIVKPAGTLIAYQPQVDDWQDFQHITFRMAFTLTPTGGKRLWARLQCKDLHGFAMCNCTSAFPGRRSAITSNSCGP